MFRASALTVLWLFVQLCHPLSFDLIVGGKKQLEFYYKDTLTHTEVIPSAHYITSVTLDPVHYRLLFTDYSYPTMSICSFDLSTRKIQPLVTRPSHGDLPRVVHDPVTRALYWKDGWSITSFSLNPASSNEADGNRLVSLDHYCNDLAVDSCGGYIYWITDYEIERARLDGSEREVLIDDIVWLRLSLAIDQQTQRMYWTEKTHNYDEKMSIKSANFNGESKTTLYIVTNVVYAFSLTISQDSIYWQNYEQEGIWQLPKNQTQDKATKLYSTPSSDCAYCQRIAANYTTNERIQGIKSCDALQGLILNDSKSESTVPICQNYCFQGQCGVSPEGRPTCSCKAGYSGERCEVNACHKHCLNGGVCSLNEANEPTCQCTAGYGGARCDVSICKDYCFYGNCSIDAEGEPTCSCKAGYSGDRCEVNNAICYPNEEDEPACECTADYEGERCDVAITQTGDRADNTTQQVLRDLRSEVSQVIKEELKRILHFSADKLDEYEAKI